MSWWTFAIGSKYNDFRVFNGNLLISRGSEAIKEQLTTALNTELGEWFLNSNFGVPYYAGATIGENANVGILGSNASAAEISAILQRVILETPGVLSITAFSISQDITRNRGVSVTATVAVETGEVNGTSTVTVSV